MPPIIGSAHPERRDLAMAFGDWGRYADRTNLLSQCERWRNDTPNAVGRTMVEACA